MTQTGTSKGPRVFVDAKITSKHLKDAPKRTIVAYVVEGRDELKNATDVKADETDDAELHAIAFAIHELKDKLAGTRRQLARDQSSRSYLRRSGSIQGSKLSYWRITLHINS